MKKILKLVPTTVLVSIVSIAITAGASFAYNAASYQGQVIIIEPVNLITSEPFQVTMAPGETDQLNMQLVNDADVPVTVYPSWEITPDPGQEIVVEMNSAITIPAGETCVVNADIMATTSVEPGTYEVSIQFSR